MAVDNKINQQDSGTLSELITSPGFDKLNNELKGKAIEAFHETESNKTENETGKMGHLFGNKSENIALYIAFIICMSLIIVGFIYILISPDYKVNTNIEFWQIIGPIITGALGFIFGAGAKLK